MGAVPWAPQRASDAFLAPPLSDPQTRQKWHLGETEFQSTPNTRNEMMLKEAGEFASHLKRCEKDIRALKNATEGAPPPIVTALPRPAPRPARRARPPARSPPPRPPPPPAGLLITSKVVLASPLPRVYEETSGGKVVPVAAAAAADGAAPNTSAAMTPIGGADFCGEELARVAKETGKKLESEVLAPMERWMNAFALVHNRMKKLEALRLEVDSRRRTVARLGRRVDVQRAQLPQTRARGEYEMESTIKVLQHKESKLSACRQSYKEHEALVYHQLTNLIRDTVWLKSYLSAVLRVEAEAFGVANVALGSMKAALPAALTAGAATASGGGAAPAPTGLTNSLDGTSEAIAAARGDGAPVRGAGGGGGKRDHGISITATAATKDSLYTMSDDAAGGGGHRAASAGAGAAAYDRYGVADSTYSRQPMSAW
jgi:hypothetical protein